MKHRLQSWLAETHGTRFELLRHFLARFFDSELVTSPGEWSRVAASAFALISCSWMILAGLLRSKYGLLASANLSHRRAAEALADQTMLTAMAMSLTLILIAIFWQTLYPNLRDYLSLAALPIRSSEIFTAKFASLAIVFGAYTLVLLMPTALTLNGATGAPLAPAFAALTAGCGIVFFGMLALQGLLLNLLPSRIFHTVSLWLQAILAAAGVAGFPLAAWKAHTVAGDLPVTARNLALAAFLPPSIAILTYLLSFHRHRKLVLEAPLPRAPHRYDLLTRFLDLTLRDPREQAAFAFFWKTIQRSRIHRLAVLVYAGLSLAWVAQNVTSMLARDATADTTTTALVTAPIALLLFSLLGLRQMFSFPVELRANWLFQFTEREGRRAWLNAIEHFVLICAVIPIVLAGALFIAWSAGPLTAAAWAALALLLAAATFEYLFRNWRKLPFTCAYLPGKKPLLYVAGLYFAFSPLVVTAAWILYYAASNPASFLILLSIEAGIWLRWRRARLSTLGLFPLVYHEQLETGIDSYGLSDDGTTLAQEQFHREWSDYLRRDPEMPLVRPLESNESRLERIWDWLKALPGDLAYAVRTLAKRPGFALTAVFTLALGLGLNGAFFTLFNAFALRPLAVHDPASLYVFNLQTREETPVHLPIAEIDQLRTAVSPAFSAVAASDLLVVNLDDRAAKAGIVTSNYFTLLGINTVKGRRFEQFEQDPVLVLNYKTWQNRFGADNAILGRKLRVNGHPFTVIGIAPESFAGHDLGGVDFWMPMEVWLPLVTGENRSQPGPTLLGRLRPRFHERAATAMVHAYLTRTNPERPTYLQVFRTELESLDVPVTWTALRYFFPLLFAFCLTMAIPCANAANMMLARAMVRQQELGVRIALGASRGRIVRQLLAEALILAILAGAAGLALARLTLDSLVRLLYFTAPPTLLFRFRLPELNLDARVFLYMLLVATLTSATFALVPAAQATRAAVTYAIRGQFGAWRASRLRDALVVGQIAACALLLIVAAVLLQGSRQMNAVDRGYDATNVFAVGNQSVADRQVFMDALEQEPWVEVAAYIGQPLTDMSTLEARAAASQQWQTVYYASGSARYFDLLRIPFQRGRTFTNSEAETKQPVLVITETAAKQLLPGQDPIGQTLSLQYETGDPRLPRFNQGQVIGVVRDIISRSHDNQTKAAIFFPQANVPGAVATVRGKGTPDQTRRQFEATLNRTAAGAHGAWVIGMQETIDWEVYPQRAATWLSSLLGAVALLLILTGMFGVMSYLVAQRTKEVGIRIALGATAPQIAEHILTYSARLTAIGLAVGSILALGTLQYLRTQLDENLAIDYLNLPAYAAALLTVTLGALTAALLPARRATKIQPTQALNNPSA